MSEAAFKLQSKPRVLDHHDYREYLKAWLQWSKEINPEQSLRKVAEAAGLSPSFLSMVLSGQRPLTVAAVKQLKDVLGLTSEEALHLRGLVRIAEGKDRSDRVSALRKIQGTKAYRRKHPVEFETFEYLSKWYFVAIRELATMPEFKLDVSWIQKQIQPKLKPKEITEALVFLKKHGFLVKGEDGQYRAQRDQIQCMAGVYRLSLTEFHQQMFGLAIQSIHSASREERMILGHTLAVSQAGYQKISALMQETLEKIQAIEREDQGPERLYHVGLAAFPLSKGKGQVS